MPESRYHALFEFCRGRYDHGDPSHDFAHVLRVLATCERFGKSLGARLEILIPAALLHDIVQVPKNHPDRAQASAQAADEAGRILRDHGLADDPEALARIAEAILEHSFSAGRKPSSLESAILQDADRLDAIGAIGIARVFSCGTRMGSEFYERTEPFARTRPLDDKRYMLDHFFVKLLKLPALMNTAPGREEAERRLKHMRDFLTQLESEIRQEPGLVSKDWTA